MLLLSAISQRPLRLCVIFLFLFSFFVSGCRKSRDPHLTIGSKFFTEQIILAELLPQHIEARTGLHVERKSNLGGTLLCHKAPLAVTLHLPFQSTPTPPT